MPASAGSASSAGSPSQRNIAAHCRGDSTQMRTQPSRQRKIGYRCRASGRPRGPAAADTPAVALPPMPKPGSRVSAVASNADTSAWSPAPVCSRCRYAAIAAHAACSAVDSDASCPGGMSGGRPGSPDRDSTPAMARRTCSVACQSR